MLVFVRVCVCVCVCSIRSVHPEVGLSTHLNVVCTPFLPVVAGIHERSVQAQAQLRLEQQLREEQEHAIADARRQAAEIEAKAARDQEHLAAVARKLVEDRTREQQALERIQVCWSVP